MTMRYLRGLTVPRKIPKGRVLVHNHVVPVGFHKWTFTRPSMRLRSLSFMRDG